MALLPIQSSASAGVVPNTKSSSVIAALRSFVFIVL